MANTKITLENIEDNSITESKLASNAVTSDKIATGAVRADKLNITGNGTNSQFLRSDGDGSFTWDTPVGYTGPKMTTFTSSGTFTVPAGVTSCRVFVIGGGGGGRIGYAGTDGAQGGWVQAYIGNLTPGSNISVTVGNGGAFQAGNGGTSSFGSYATGTGGQGVNGNPPSNRTGSGSVGSGATLLTRGNNNALVYNTAGGNFSGYGFPSWLLGNWRGTVRSATYGAGTNTSHLTWSFGSTVYPGSGGASQNSSNGAGTYAGVKGVVIVEY